ncbi:MAG TPA: GNAT family N-acetyltransferase [Anaeromyxobacteraceae bacterium]|nr:GNAT family N-acetyltransferase [Anaeromyxobacteraceae bacterium]
MLSHRAVQPDDIPSICEFPQSPEELYFLFPKGTYPLTPEQLRRSIEQRFGSTVVLDQGRVCAFANLYCMKPEGTSGIGNVIVAPDVRGKGVGRYLIETMIRTALRERGARSVQIACFNANVSGLLLYQKLGFEPYMIEPRLDHQARRIALVRMRLSEAATAKYAPALGVRFPNSTCRTADDV